MYSGSPREYERELIKERKALQWNVSDAGGIMGLVKWFGPSRRRGFWLLWRCGGGPDAATQDPSHTQAPLFASRYRCAVQRVDAEHSWRACAFVTEDDPVAFRGAGRADPPGLHAGQSFYQCGSASLAGRRAQNVEASKATPARAAHLAGLSGNRMAGTENPSQPFERSFR